jgi:hypothetical protein
MLKAINEIATIIERDSKDTTYKFALLRACIQISQEYEHFAKKEIDQVTFPLGLIVLKWLEYYYSIFADYRFIPQKNGDTPARSLAFRNSFLEVIKFYNSGLGFYQFQKNLKDGDFEKANIHIVFNLVKNIKETIVKMPMNYIGSSVGRGGQIFRYNKDSNLNSRNLNHISNQYIIDSCGTFSIPRNYFDAFLILGSFINGTQSLLLEWVDFTIHADKEKKLTRGEVLNLIDPCYDKNRDANELKLFFERIEKNRELHCIWSGKKIVNDLNIDHMMPFSLWKNNDFWNLLPSKSNVNNKKRDKIPCNYLLTKQRDLIIDYWELIFAEYPVRFQKEVQISLLGLEQFDKNNWQFSCFESFSTKCEFLINQRGFEPFTI